MSVDLSVIEGGYLQDILDEPRALRDTFEGLAVSAQLSELAGRLREGDYERIVLTGMGSSFHALHPLDLRLVDHGFTAFMVETSELIHYGVRLFDPKTLMVAVSQSGQSAEIVRLSELNRKRSPVIAATNTPESPLATEATAAVFTKAGREFSVSCKTYVATLMVLEWLGDVLCGGNGERCGQELSEAAPAVESYLSLWKEYVCELAQVLDGIRHLFLVGRGASLAAVNTGALIVKESDHLHAEGMSSAAFRHGPLEMLSKETFVLVFSGDDKTRDLNQRLVADIRQGGGRGEIVGGDSPRECFQLRNCNGRIRPILEILPVQMVTLALAALVGREPGRFERVTKVTTTE